MCSTNNHAGNIESLKTLVQDAAAAKANMLCLPEVSGLTNCRYSEAKKVIGEEKDDPYLSACQELAASHQLWIHNGSIPVQDAGQPLPVNRTHLITPDGTIAARYDKIHLFDISLNEAKQVLESKRYAGGTESILAQTPWGPMGLSIVTTSDFHICIVTMRKPVQESCLYRRHLPNRQGARIGRYYCERVP
jgi:predicted amidohydrolase